MIIVILIFLGLCFGSFVNALVFRLHMQSKQHSALSTQHSAKKSNESLTANSQWLSADGLSVLKGRSMCPNCGHQLAAKDLIPVLSWLLLKGKCRYCQKPISWQYPAVELAAVLVFVASYLFWPGGLHAHGAIVLFITWLATSVGLLALLVYDFRWMLLPSKVIYPTLFVAIAGRLGYILFFTSDKAHSFWLLTFSLLVASGLFWLIFMASKGAWIGYGDVRLGLITGTVLADPLKSFLMIFVASLLGLIFIFPAIVLKRKSLSSRIPYGPFLIAATSLTLLFGQSVIDWYKRLFI